MLTFTARRRPNVYISGSPSCSKNHAWQAQPLSHAFVYGLQIDISRSSFRPRANLVMIFAVTGIYEQSQNSLNGGADILGPW